MESREDYRKRLVEIEWKLLDMRQALKEARQLSEELAETHSTRLAVHDLSEAVWPGLTEQSNTLEAISKVCRRVGSAAMIAFCARLTPDGEATLEVRV